MKAMFLIILILFLGACGTAQHSVRVDDEQAFQPSTKVLVDKVTNKTGETFDIDVEQMLRDAMDSELKKENLLAHTSDTGAVTMNLNIVEYSKGDAFKRWLMIGYGSTTLVIEATLLDTDGNVDATAQVSRSVDAGGQFTIGAWEYIFDKVAADLISDLKAKTEAKTD